MSVNRRATYKLNPSKAQAAEMERQLELHRLLFNGALQERRDAWKRKVSVTLNDQYRSVKEFKSDIPDWNSIHTHPIQDTLKRLDMAFKAFFRRVAAGQKPGYPRFKLFGRYPGWGYKEHRNGFVFQPGLGWKNGYLKLSGIGWMQARGQCRTPGKVLTAVIMRKIDGWFVSIVVEIDADVRESTGLGVTSLDWGVITFATVAREIMVTGDPAPEGSGEMLSHKGVNVEISEIVNLRFLAQEIERLKNDQRALSKSTRGKKRTIRIASDRRRIAKRHRKVANRRKNHAHEESTKLVQTSGLILTEALNIKAMTASAKGTVENPGSMVAQKAGLTRSILDTAPAAFMSMLRYKAEEAGIGFIEVNTRKHKPSQTCPHCGRVEKKLLSQRVHQCPVCEFICGRDVAAALNLLWIGLKHRDDGLVLAGASGVSPGTKPPPPS